MVATVSGKAGTIGYGPLDVAKANGLKVLKIDGRSPTDSGYPSVGTIGFVYKEENFTGKVKKFVEFVRSDAAQAAIKDAGGMTL